MSEFFLKIVNMSISASWFVLAVLLLRLVLKKAPKWVSVLLWGFVAIRLVCPFSIESVLSLIPSAETVSPEIMMDRTPEVSTGISSLDAVVNPIITESFAPQPMASANPLQILIPVCGNLWVLGIFIMLLYTAISYFLLRRKVATAVLLRKHIYQSENVASPFVLGIIRPRIYLPFRMDSKNLEHVIAHEQAHIRRKDHLWKPLGFTLLALHWFNPLMWLGYVLLCRDIELACDEKVIKEMDSDAKADYSEALVACSVHRRSIAACPLAFGEVGVKSRIKSILHYKKPAFWIMIAAIVICAVVAVCFLTDPKNQTENNGETIDYEVSSIFACSGNQKVPLFSFPEGTTISQYKECVCWLTIDPRDEETVPFFLWDANEVIRGSYSAFDSETFEPLKHFIPSGLDPQTYLFQNADPTRSYIVLATLSTEPNATIYAFGARFPGSDQNNTDAKETFTGNLETYYKNADGSWECDGYIYKYRLEIKPTEAHHDPFTFVYLSNLKSITFSQAYLASGISSSLSDGFSPAEAMLVEWYSLDENGEPMAETAARKMTLDDVIRLSEKSDDLRWEDFTQFIGKDIGYGLYIMRYDIDDHFYVVVAWGDISDSPMYALLSCTHTGQAGVPIQGGQIKDFIQLCNVSQAAPPEQITGITTATLALPSKWNAPRTVTDPDTLRKIESILQRSEVLDDGANCPFTGRLFLAFANGVTLTLAVSEDNCATWCSANVYYTYGIQIMNQDVTQNNELYDLFTAQ